MNHAITTSRLTKIYDGHAAVEGLDWQIPVGSAWAFLGENGAGKSTTLRMLMGFTPAASGSCTVLGEDPMRMAPRTRERIAYVAEEPLLPPWMRVDRMVRFHASFYPRWNASLERNLLERFELSARKRISTLSKGQNRRLMLVLALCQNSDLMILDEPWSGLDVAARRELLGLLGDYLAKGERTLLISSHIVTDVERIASDVAIVRGGRLIHAAPLDELHENVKRIRMPRELWARTAEHWHSAGVLSEEGTDATQVVTVRRFDVLDPDLVNSPDVEAANLGLEDIFLALSRSQPESVAS